MRFDSDSVEWFYKKCNNLILENIIFFGYCKLAEYLTISTENTLDKVK